jgi:hypothetical protein
MQMAQFAELAASSEFVHNALQALSKLMIALIVRRVDIRRDCSWSWIFHRGEGYD